MYRHDDAQRGIGAFEFLADQAERDVIISLAAVAHRNADAKDAKLGHARQKFRVHLLLAIPFADDGDDLTGGEFAHHLLCLQMFFSQ